MLKEFFNHFVMSDHNICNFGYMWLFSKYLLARLDLLFFMRFCLVEAISLILSVLTMLWRDIRKLITSLMRMLMYFSPVIWDCHFDAKVPFHNLFKFFNEIKSSILYSEWIS